MVAIPIDADACVSKAFVSTVERNVLVDLVFVLGNVGLHAFEAGLFFNGENENQIAFRLDLCFVQRADRSEQRFDVSRIVADSGRVHFAVLDRRLDLQSRLEDGVQVRVKNDHGAAASSLSHGNQVSGGIVGNVYVVSTK